MKVENILSPLLDLWVARALGFPDSYIGTHKCFLFCTPDNLFQPREYSPSEDWEEGGHLITQHRIGTYWSISEELDVGDWLGRTKNWVALLPDGTTCRGADPLIAAMRALVVSKYGPEVHENDAQSRRSDRKVIKEIHMRLGGNNKAASKPSDEMA
jgi:hypothetical protein